MVFKFRGKGDDEVYNDRRVEIQIRTRLQHSWATAVEAVGLFRREDLKAGQGDPDWLQLFRLMSAEFLLIEGCGSLDDGHQVRLAEIAALNKRLHAVQTLEDLRQAVKITDSYVFDPTNKPDYYLIRYDRSNNAVKVSAEYGPTYAVQSYDNAESIDPAATNGRFNTVLVEVDDIESLKAAYPNYFGDVELFRDQLILATGSEPASFKLEPQLAVPKRQKEQPDFSWMYKRKR